MTLSCSCFRYSAAPALSGVRVLLYPTFYIHFPPLTSVTISETQLRWYPLQGSASQSLGQHVDGGSLSAQESTGPEEYGYDHKLEDDAVWRLAKNSFWWPLCLPEHLQDSRVGSFSSRWLLDQKSCSMLMEKAWWQGQRDTWIKSLSLQACLKFHFVLFHLLFSGKDGF